MCERLPPGEVHAYRISVMTPSVPCCATVGSSHAHPCGNSPRDSIRELIASVSTRPGMVNCRSSLRAVLTLDSTAFQPAVRLCPNAERMVVFERPVGLEFERPVGLELITSAAAVKRSRCAHALVPKLFPPGCVSCIKAAHTLSTWTLLALALGDAVTPASDPASIVGPLRPWTGEPRVPALVMFARSVKASSSSAFDKPEQPAASRCHRCSAMVTSETNFSEG